MDQPRQESQLPKNYRPIKNETSKSKRPELTGDYQNQMKYPVRFLLCLGTIWCSLLPAADRPPNIVILLADDLGYGELGCQGNQQIPTPHIDSIAKNGVRFTDGYVTAPVCSPSRAGLMSGRLQARFSYHTNVKAQIWEFPHLK